MFGFLRRKKPADAGAHPDAVAPPLETGSGPDTAPPIDDAELEAAALAAAPPDATEAATREAEPGGDPGAGASRPAFWSRWIPGGRAPAPAPVEPAVAAPVAEACAPAIDAPAPAIDAPTATPAAPTSPAGTELVPAPIPDRAPWFARLKQGLNRTSGNIAGLFVGVKVDEALFEELEAALLTSDAGVETTAWLLDRLRARVKQERIADPMQVKAALRALLVELLTPLEQPIDIDRAEPLVVMIAGVNGAGKTTSIGKLARHLRREGKSVLLAAGDTFRAAAREQLAQWGSRNEVEVIAQQGGDPAAVAFDAVSAGRARSTGVVIVDTAGRLPTQTHLMDELRKIRRVIGKAMDGAPHEVLLVLDGNTGQNMLAQVKAFDQAVQLTGLVVTKLDGTARGGALAALARTRRERPIPVYFIGVGEGIDDLQAFSAQEFAAALVD
jgi:fused signal recognition particle receptor